MFRKSEQGERRRARSAPAFRSSCQLRAVLFCPDGWLSSKRVELNGPCEFVEGKLSEDSPCTVQSMEVTIDPGVAMRMFGSAPANTPLSIRVTNPDGNQLVNLMESMQSRNSLKK